MMIIEKENPTALKLSDQATFREFMITYLRLLKKELQVITVMNEEGMPDYQYYTCGQDHDRRNPRWKPFRILELLCKRFGYDDREVGEIIEERIGKRLTCECELLVGDTSSRKGGCI